MDAPPVLLPAAAGIRTIENLLHASILLETPPFPVSMPLPPYTVADPLTLQSDVVGWVVPYAVGRLQLVNRKLLGYRAADLAHIENVMRGEKRVTQKRKLSRTEETELHQVSDLRSQSGSSNETKKNFEQEAQEAAAESFSQFTYDNLTSTYGGPTTFTLTGSWESTHGDSTPAQFSASGFAEKIIAKTLQRVRRQVDEQRQRVHMDETEESTSSTFDNSLGTCNLHGVYRWLNKVYEARVVNYGSRLLLEFMVKDPAATFAAECLRLFGIDLKRPKRLAEFAIISYHDITVSPSQPAVNGEPVETTVEQALRYYDITDWPLEPAAEKTVSVVLQAGQRISIPLPEGYAASYAVVTLPVNASTAPSSEPTAVMPAINGIIGQSAFDNTSIETAAAPGAPVTNTPFLQVTMHGETGSIAAVLFDIYAPQQSAITGLPAIPPAGGGEAAPAVTAPAAPPVISEVSVSVTIGCVPTTETTKRWQLAVFKLLVEAEKQKQEAYYNLLLTTREKGGRWLPPDLGALERRALQQDCTDLLFDVFYALTGVPAEPLETNPPDLFTVYEPVVRQFFGESVEWNELSYALTADVHHRRGKQGDTAAQQEQLPENNLAAFLQAQYARVLVPVRPSMSLSLLYFLATGVVWQGPPEQVPVLAQSLQAAFAIKTERPEAYRQIESLPWTFEIPTAMLVLDDRPELFLAADANCAIAKKIQP